METCKQSGDDLLSQGDRLFVPMAMVSLSVYTADTQLKIQCNKHAATQIHSCTIKETELIPIVKQRIKNKRRGVIH